MCMYSYIYIDMYIYIHRPTKSRSHSEDRGLPATRAHHAAAEILIASAALAGTPEALGLVEVPPALQDRAYGQFSKFHVCFCGLDPGNLKLETVRTHKQHICF